MKRFIRTCGATLFSLRAVSLLLVALVAASGLVYLSTPQRAEALAPSEDTAVTLGPSSYLSTNTQVIPASGSFSVEAWIKPTAATNWNMIVSQGSATAFYIQRVDGSKMYWRYGNYGADFGWKMTQDQWTHIAFIYSEATSGNNVTIYVNGEVSYTWAAGTTKLTGLTTNFVAGGYSADLTNTNYRWRGHIDDLRVYKSALPAATVRTHMNTYADTTDANLAAYYDFNDSSNLSNMAAGAAKVANSTLTPTYAAGTTSLSWEKIAQTNTVGTQQYVAFLRSYLTKDGGWTVPAGAASINYLAVGAGGGGGGWRHAGGGGAGAALQKTNLTVTSGEKLTVSVGAGGLAGAGKSGSNGGASVITGGAFTETAIGGGGGGAGGSAGLPGASGGGGGASSGSGGAGTTGLGFAGGQGRMATQTNGYENWHGGGGGGATSAGKRASVNCCGTLYGADGGAGISFEWVTPSAIGSLRIGQLSGTSVYFSGGGAGGRFGDGTAGTPGPGGGVGYGGAAFPNTGAGGGGGSTSDGGSGGSGLVFISYSTVPNAPSNLVATPTTDVQVDLTWTAPIINGATVTEYVIERSLSSSFTSPTVVNTGTTSLSYSVTGLTNATRYYFRVSAKNPTSTGAVSSSANALTWKKIGSGDCVDYVTSDTGVTTALNGDRCVVTFPAGVNDWSLHQGATAIDVLVVGGGGGGGAAAGSGGSGGAVIDSTLSLGTSKITQFGITVGAAGTGGSSATPSQPTAGGQSSFTGTDGVNSLTLSSPGGGAGVNGLASSAAAAATAVSASSSKTGTIISFVDRLKRATTPGGIGMAQNNTSDPTMRATGGAGYSTLTTLFATTGPFGGSGAGGAIEPTSTPAAVVAGQGTGGDAGGYYPTTGISDSGASGSTGVVVISYKLVNPPVVLTSPSASSVGAGTSTSFSASFSSAVSEIRWQVSSTAGTTWTDVIGATTSNSASSTYTITSAALIASGNLYRAVGKNIVGAAFAEAATTGAVLTVTKDSQPLPVGALCDGNSTQNGLTTSAGHGQVFYIDTGQGQNIDAGYVAYSVKTDKSRNDLWVEVSGFSGGVLSLADPSTGSMPLGNVDANSSGTAYFMLKASGATTVAQSHVLRVYNQKPDIGNPSPIYECSFSFTRVDETIKAAANKVDSITSTSVSSIGSTMTITVKGDSGTIGSGNDLDGRMFWLIPAARSTWPVSAVRLEKTTVKMYKTVTARDSAATDNNLLGSFTDQLRINATNGLAADSRQFWTATYTYRIIGPAASTAPIIPVAMIASGTQIKHTDVSSVPGGTLDLRTVTSSLQVTKDVSSSAEVRSDGTTRFDYDIALKNTGTADLVVDEVIDNPDLKASYVPGSSNLDGTPISDPGHVGTSNSIAFSGPIVVPAGSTRHITYKMAIETCKAGGAYSVQNSATARSGSIVIGSGSSTKSVVTINANCGSSNVDVFVDNTVPLGPDVLTSPADTVTQTSGNINGTIDPQGVAGQSLRFVYSTNSTLSASTSSVSIASTTTSQVAYGVTTPLSGLQPDTTYYYRLEVQVTQSDGGVLWQLGEILSFTTPPTPAPPVASTTAVTAIHVNGATATFNGTIDPNLTVNGVKVKFEYGIKVSGSCPASGTRTDFLTSADTLTPTDIVIAAGAGPTPLSLVMAGLTAGTDYCVRIIGFYDTGYATEELGDWVSFTTPTVVAAELQTQIINWNTGTDPLPAGGTTTVQAFADSLLPVTYTSVDPSICTVNPSTGAVTAVATSGNCVITATQAGDATHYAAQPSTISFLISPPVITTTTLATGTYSSIFSDTIQAIGGNGSYSSWTATGEMPPGLTLNSTTGEISGTPTVAGIYVIYVTVQSNGITSETQPLTITINKIALAVTAQSYSLTYSDVAPVVAPLYDTAAFVGSDSSTTMSTSPNIPPTCTTDYTHGTDVGVIDRTTTCSGGWAVNYSYSFVRGSITINPYKLSVTAMDAAKKVGQSDPTFTYQLSPSLPAGQSMSDVLTSSGLVSISRTAGSAAGNYPITPAGTLVTKPFTRIDSLGNSSTVNVANYEVTFHDGQLVITDLLTPTLTIPSRSPLTYGDDLTGQLNATASYTSSSVPGTYEYSYIDANGNAVILTEASLLAAGTYTVTVKFTPADNTTYYGPIFGNLTLIVNPYQLVLQALPNAKQNLLSTSTRIVNSDPTLKYVIKRKLPLSQTLSDVFAAGVNVDRAKSGTAPGHYPVANTSIAAKEQVGLYTITPSAEYSRNYAVSILTSDFEITQKIVPDIVSSNQTQTENVALGTKLNATPSYNNNAVAGTLEYTYFDAAGNEKTATSTTALPRGLYNVKIKFTPSDTTTYYGPVYSVMLLDVTAPAPQNNNGGGGINGGNGGNGASNNGGGNALTPVVPNTDPFAPRPVNPNPFGPNPNNGSGANGNSSNSSRPVPIYVAPYNGPYVQRAPSAPGLGGLIAPQVSDKDPITGLVTADSQARVNTWLADLAKLTKDVGLGIQQVRAEDIRSSVVPAISATRSMTDLAQEKFSGFSPPGSGVRIEVLGARSGARFIVSDIGQLDSQALLSMLNASKQSEQSNFFSITNVEVGAEPKLPTQWSAEEQRAIDEFFAAAGLSSPASLAAVTSSMNNTWVAVNARASSYVPGSVVYLAVTSSPLVIGSAIVQADGTVDLAGAMPVEYLGAGDHNIRLVGTRLLDGVTVDKSGVVQVSDSTMREIERFDLQTQATIALTGTNKNGGGHVALRVIPLTPTVPWWTLVLLVLVGLALIVLRRRGILFGSRQQLLVAPTLILIAAIPAVVFGWLSTVTVVMWTGIAVGLALAITAWFTRPRARRIN